MPEPNVRAELTSAERDQLDRADQLALYYDRARGAGNHYEDRADVLRLVDDVRSLATTVAVLRAGLRQVVASLDASHPLTARSRAPAVAPEPPEPPEPPERLRFVVRGGPSAFMCGHVEYDLRLVSVTPTGDQRQLPGSVGFLAGGTVGAERVADVLNRLLDRYVVPSTWTPPDDPVSLAPEPCD